MTYEERNPNGNQDNDEDPAEKEGRFQEKDSLYEREDPSAATGEIRESNCVSTIKKCSVLRSGDRSGETLAIHDDFETTSNLTLPKNHRDGRTRRQNDVHWRRRTAETLKPS